MRPGARIRPGRHRQNTPERIRTSGLCLRRAALYPAELRAQGAVMIPRLRSRVNPAARRALRQEDGRHKPSSVDRLSGGPGSFVWDPDCSGPRAAYPGLGRDRRSLVPYLALLRMGFAMRPLLPAARCALTAPFHPCLCPSLREAIGGLLSAALSVASRRPGVTRHPALRSSDFPPHGEPAGSRRRSLGPSSWTHYKSVSSEPVVASPSGQSAWAYPVVPWKKWKHLFVHYCKFSGRHGLICIRVIEIAIRTGHRTRCAAPRHTGVREW